MLKGIGATLWGAVAGIVRGVVLSSIVAGGGGAANHGEPIGVTD